MTSKQKDVPGISTSNADRLFSCLSIPCFRFRQKQRLSPMYLTYPSEGFTVTDSLSFALNSMFRKNGW